MRKGFDGRESGVHGRICLQSTSEDVLRFHVEIPEFLVEPVGSVPMNLASDRDFDRAFASAPFFDASNQQRADALAAGWLADHQTSDFDAEVRFQQRGQKTMDPAHDPGRFDDGDQKAVTGMGQDSLEARREGFGGGWVSEFIGQGGESGRIRRLRRPEDGRARGNHAGVVRHDSDRGVSR